MRPANSEKILLVSDIYTIGVPLDVLSVIGIYQRVNKIIEMWNLLFSAIVSKMDKISSQNSEQSK